MSFAHVETWIFDLDETLYPATTPLFPQIEARMTAWIVATLGVSQAEADLLRARWWHDHGTTLAGLMREHGVDPDPFLDDVHRVDFSVLDPDPGLRDALAALPGRRIVHTNGTAPYARAVLDARGLGGVWDGIYGIEHGGYAPKPDAESYARIRARDGLDPTRAAMFEDVSRNLIEPHRLGMVTVLVGPAQDAGDHIRHRTPDLAAFLRDVVAGLRAADA